MLQVLQVQHSVKIDASVAPRLVVLLRYHLAVGAAYTPVAVLVRAPRLVLHLRYVAPALVLHLD